LEGADEENKATLRSRFQISIIAELEGGKTLLKSPASTAFIPVFHLGGEMN
jgi:hypothetical protein